MRKVEKVVGTAFTRRRMTQVVAETPNEIEDALRQWAEAECPDDPWADNRREVQAARAALALEIAAKPERYRFKEREDLGWYLERLVVQGTLVQHHIDNGSPAWAAHEAALFGETICEMRLKMARELIFNSGKGSRDGSLDGAAKRADAFKAHHAQIRADYAERLARLGDKGRAKEATARNAEITRRQLNRILAK